MSIYTKTGDDGTTALFGGHRLLKTDSQVEAYGAVDELTSTLGVLMTHIEQSKEKEFIAEIQQDLYMIMGHLANAPTDLSMQKERIILFEKKIDTITSALPKLTKFLLPRGSIASCWAHMARVVCRRAERSIIRFFQKNDLMQKKDSIIIMAYINRLSDLLFTFARLFNNDHEAISTK